ncbi:MAG: type II secretion system GspH family protein [Endomicrobium sp.]|jgi:prepilin-type N-terminal cleavage/methylation domain-containing protein|nr:type II secretion system GspH family protein [Endomicrobium sp.]
MKKSRAFTLIEVMLVMMITTIIAAAFGILLIKLYNFSNRALDKSDKNEGYLYFRVKLDSQLRNARSRYVLMEDAEVINKQDIIRLYSDFAGANWWSGGNDISGFSDASKPRISRAFAFYFFDENAGETVRIEYRFTRPPNATPDNPDRRANVICTVWAADLTVDVGSTTYYKPEEAAYAEVVLGDVVDFMATTHRKPSQTGGNLATDGEDSQDVWTINHNTRRHAGEVVLYVNLNMAADVEVPYVREVVFVNRTVRIPYRIGSVRNT